MPKCTCKTEVYSRIVGYYRPVQEWNEGKKAEFKDREKRLKAVKFMKAPKETEGSEKTSNG